MKRGWRRLSEWETEQAYCCEVCGLVLVGRDLSYIPIFCEKKHCPGPRQRERVVVRPVEQTNQQEK